jgi:hypothetical protein
MTYEQDTSPLDSSKWIDQGDLFYRPNDKVEFLEGLNAVYQMGQGIAVVASNEVMLNHYCRLMVSRLRKAKGFKVEVLLPSTTDSLLKRFNHIMTQMSLDEALRPAAENSMVTLMVVNDAHLIDQQQWVLLSQLISDFPGVNVRLVAFIDSDEWIEYDQALNLFGQKLHRWEFEQPSMNDVDSLFSIAESVGRVDEAEKLLEGLIQDVFIEHSELNFEEVDSEDKNLIDSVRGVSKDTKAQNCEQDKDIVQDSIKRTGSSPWLWASAMILIFVTSLSVTSFLNPKFFNSHIGPLLSFNQVIHPTRESDQPQNLLEENIQKAALKSTSASMGDSSEVNGQAEINLSLSLDLDLQASESKKIVTDAKPNSYFVQFNLFKTKETAHEYSEQTGIVSKSLIVSLQSDQGVVHGIISGPFLTKEEAQSFVIAPGMPKNFWIRSAQTLQSRVI